MFARLHFIFPDPKHCNAPSVSARLWLALVQRFFIVYLCLCALKMLFHIVSTIIDLVRAEAVLWGLLVNLLAVFTFLHWTWNIMARNFNGVKASTTSHAFSLAARPATMLIAHNSLPNIDSLGIRPPARRNRLERTKMHRPEHAGYDSTVTYLTK